MSSIPRHLPVRQFFLIAILALLMAPGTADAVQGNARAEAYLAREALKTLCMQHRLDREATLRQAEAEGWRRLPDGEFPRVGGLYDAISGMHLTNLAALSKPSPRGGMVLLLGDGGSAGPGCAIAFHAPFATASSVIGGHFMLPVRRFDTISPAYHLWAFVEEDGKRRQAVKSYFGKIDQALIARATANRTFATIAVTGQLETDTSVFLYSIPPPARDKAH